MNRVPSSILCLAVVALLLLSGMQFAEAQSEDETILRCGIKYPFNTNPFNADADDWNVLGRIYEGATRRDQTTGELIPYIAVGSANLTSSSSSITWDDCIVGNFGYSPKKTWEDSDKPEIVIFYDFENVKWHDGVPMTIRDILFSLHVHAPVKNPWMGNPLMDKGGAPGTNYSLDNWLFIEKAWESQDETRAALRFVLQKPLYSVFEDYLSDYILPYHIWGFKAANQFVDGVLIWSDPEYNALDQYSWKSWMAVRWLNINPVGSGPFVWSGMVEDCITLVKWEEHFYRPGFKYANYEDTAPTQPSIDGISFMFYTSEDSALLDLGQNRLDIIAWNLPQSITAQFVNNRDIQAEELRATSMTYLGFNMQKTSFGYGMGKSLRKAITHCIDSQGINAMSGFSSGSEGELNTFKMWENASAPSHTLDPPEAINILRKAGYVPTNVTEPPGIGNWWLNPDGSKIGSTYSGSIDLLVLESSQDQLGYSVANMISSQMREIGINVELLPLEPTALENRLVESDFDMCLVKENIPATYRNRPENYLFSAFDSSNIIDGPNYVGYANASFDRVVEAAMNAPDRDEEMLLVQDAFATIAYDIPVCSLYYSTNTEIYRLANFQEFLDDGSGTLINTLSLASVRKQNKKTLMARFTSIPLTTVANSSFPVRVKVTDQNGDPVEGADVWIHVTTGNLSAGFGVTDAMGIMSVDFTAPPVHPDEKNGTSIMISIESVSKLGYRSTQGRLAMTTVFPEGTMFVQVRAEILQDVVSDRDFSGSVGFTYMDIFVSDHNNMPVSHASVIIDINGTALDPEFTTGLTDAEGYLRVTFTANPVASAEECTITVTASKIAHSSGSVQASVIVIPGQETVVVEQPDGGSNWAYAAIPIILVLACLIYLWRRKAGKGKRA